MTNLAALGFLEALRPNTWLVFHMDMFIVPLYNILCQSGPVCPQAILPMRVRVFPSGMLGVTNIPSINVSDTFFCLEFSRECAGESIMSLRIIFFEI